MAGLCLENNLGLVVMQYPLRKIDSLKKIFPDTAGRIVFVENFDPFYDAVKKYGYKHCFIDRTGADCGALTQAADELVGRNLAGRLIRLIADSNRAS